MAGNPGRAGAAAAGAPRSVGGRRGVRLFAAVELPDAERRRLGRRVSDLRSRFPPAAWVRPENLHATLAFVGEAGPEAADTASA
ncbi:MAG: hypothetical protein F9K18_14150, partial [Thermoanaerobaculia bacterium]